MDRFIKRESRCGVFDFCRGSSGTLCWLLRRIYSIFINPYGQSAASTDKYIHVVSLVLLLSYLYIHGMRMYRAWCTCNTPDLEPLHEGLQTLRRDFDHIQDSLHAIQELRLKKIVEYTEAETAVKREDTATNTDYIADHNECVSKLTNYSQMENISDEQLHARYSNENEIVVQDRPAVNYAPMVHNNSRVSVSRNEYDGYNDASMLAPVAVDPPEIHHYTRESYIGLDDSEWESATIRRRAKSRAPCMIPRSNSATRARIALARQRREEAAEQERIKNSFKLFSTKPKL